MDEKTGTAMAVPAVPRPTALHSLFESLPRACLNLLDGVFSPLHHPVLISTHNKVHCASNVINLAMYMLQDHNNIIIGTMS